MDDAPTTAPVPPLKVVVPTPVKVKVVGVNGVVAGTMHSDPVTAAAETSVITMLLIVPVPPPLVTVATGLLAVAVADRATTEASEGGEVLPVERRSR